MNTLSRFRLDGKVAIITGGAGLLGVKHAEVIAEAGGIPILWDIDQEGLYAAEASLRKEYSVAAAGMLVDIAAPDNTETALKQVLKKYRRVDILINNAANDPKVQPGEKPDWGRLENLSMARWENDISVGLTGSFLCSRFVGTHMAEHGGGVILNIASDLGIIAPDQRIYKQPGLPTSDQPVKPITYSVVKHGIIGLTKYLATYWAESGVRVNSISPGGVYTGQPEMFLEKLTRLIPLSRMAAADEYQAAVLFLVSDASSYMTGANLVIDGGRTCW